MKPFCILAALFVLSCLSVSCMHNEEEKAKGAYKASSNADSMEAVKAVHKLYNWYMGRYRKGNYNIFNVNLVPVSSAQIKDTMKEPDRYDFWFDPKTDTSATWFQITMNFDACIDSLRHLDIFTQNFLHNERKSYSICEAYIQKSILNDSLLDESYDEVEGKHICSGHVGDRLMGSMELPDTIILSNFVLTDTAISLYAETNLRCYIKLVKAGNKWKINSLETAL